MTMLPNHSLSLPIRFMLPNTLPWTVSLSFRDSDRTNEIKIYDVITQDIRLAFLVNIHMSVLILRHDVHRVDKICSISRTLGVIMIH
jgi:hypothetical protein